MALHDDRHGAIAPTLLPFPRTESRDDADLPELTKLLGKVYDMHDGISAVLVRALADMPKAAIDASYALSADNPLIRTVGLATTSDVIAGYTFPGQKDVLLGELHFMLVPTPGEGRVTILADAGAISGGGVYLTAGIVGTVAEGAGTYDSLLAPGIQIMKSLEAVAAGEAGDVMFCASTVF